MMTKVKKSLAIGFLFLPLATISLQAAEMHGVKIADEVKLGGKMLVLNGMGMRQKTFLNVNVYIGALYLEKKSQDAQEILSSPEYKRVELAFVHSASQSQVRDAFQEAYEDNCKPDCDALKAPFDQLKSLMAAVEVGERLAFDIFPTKVDVWVKGVQVGSINDPVFAKALPKTWLGEHPPTESLKQAMLGK